MNGIVLVQLFAINHSIFLVLGFILLFYSNILFLICSSIVALHITEILLESVLSLISKGNHCFLTTLRYIIRDILFSFAHLSGQLFQHLICLLSIFSIQCLRNLPFSYFKLCWRCINGSQAQVYISQHNLW